jgi:hypothetical protein
MQCYKKRGTTPETQEAIKKLIRQPLTSFEEAWALVAADHWHGEEPLSGSGKVCS